MNLSNISHTCLCLNLGKPREPYDAVGKWKEFTQFTLLSNGNYQSTASCFLEKIKCSFYLHMNHISSAAQKETEVQILIEVVYSYSDFSFVCYDTSAYFISDYFGMCKLKTEETWENNRNYFRILFAWYDISRKKFSILFLS